MREIKFRAWDTYGKHMISPEMLLQLTSVKTFARTPAPKRRVRKTTVIFKQPKEPGLFSTDTYLEVYDASVETIEMESRYFDANPFTDKDLVIMQYTGLKDKNGVEIYEGDILRWTNELNEVDDYQVIYQAPSFKYSHLHNPEYIGATRPFDELEADKDFGVIGDIYQNPELLEAAKCKGQKL